MIELLSNILLSYMKDYCLIRDDKMMKYGLEIIISFLFNLCSILIIGGIFIGPQKTIVFLLFFVPIRMVAGGLHAESYFGCYIYTHTIFLLGCILSLISWEFISAIFVLLSFVAIIYIYVNAPEENHKQKLSCEEIHLNRHRSHKMLCIYSVIICAFVIYGQQAQTYTILASYTIICVAILLFIEKKRNIEMRDD